MDALDDLNSNDITNGKKGEQFSEMGSNLSEFNSQASANTDHTR